MFHRLVLVLRSARSSAPRKPLEVRSNLGHPLPSAMPYVARRALLSAGEQAFYDCLRRAVGRRYGISIKPRVADVLECPPSMWKSAVGGRVAQRHVDFVLYDPETTEPVLAVELDDCSHERSRARERDEFLDEALYTAGVLLMRVKAAASYDALELHDWIAAHVGFRPRARHHPRSADRRA